MDTGYMYNLNTEAAILVLLLQSSQEAVPRQATSRRAGDRTPAPPVDPTRAGPLREHAESLIGT